jgi:hypothetical protein
MGYYGHCFFRAICLSNIINILTHTDPRLHLVKVVRGMMLKPDGHTDIVISFCGKKDALQDIAVVE